jgi:NADH:ubiquinone oxidoreductase subunit 6 (subunit J)
MITWIFAALTVVSATVATFAPDLRRSNLSLWLAGLSAGALYLTLGAELLAIVQWIVSTLVAISLLFFSSMYGASRELPEGTGWRRALKIGLPLLLGLLFAFIIWHGAGFLDVEAVTPPAEGNDLRTLGVELTGRHLFSLEVLALTLFLVLVGGGVLARPEAEPEPESEAAGGHA